MTKRNKFYQIGFFTLAIAFIGLCLFVGITAVQKQMRLKVSFNATPSIYVEVKLAKITDGVTGTFEPIFNNSGTPTLGTGITLTGNKLTITENFTTANSIGASFKLQITNLMSENGLKASFSGTGAAADTEYVVMKEYSTSNTDDTAEVTVSGNSAESLFEITFEEYYFYSVNTSPASGHFTFSGANEVEQKTEYNATLKAETGYDLSIIVTRKDGTTTTLTQNTHYTWDSSTGALKIIASAVTGDITINCTTTLQTFDITFNANGGTFASNSSSTYTIEDVAYNSTYNLPTPPTRANYDFSGWQENGAGDIWDIGTKTCTGATTWVAVWEAQGCQITLNIITGRGNYPSYYGYAGYLITNNPKLTFTIADWRDSALTCTNGSKSIQISEVAPSSIPISTAFNGDGYEYIEVYYNPTGEETTEISTFTVQKGYYLFVFNHSTLGGQTMGVLTSYPTNNEATILLHHGYKPIVVKYTPTESGTLSFVAEEYYYSGST